MTRSEMNILDLSMIVPFTFVAYIYLEVTIIEQSLLITLSLVIESFQVVSFFCLKHTYYICETLHPTSSFFCY